MFLDLERLPPEGEAVDRTIEGARLTIDGEEFRLVSDVEIVGRIQRVDSDLTGVYRLVGSMSCRIEVPCVRCLEPFLMDVHEKLDLLYLPQSQNVARPRSPQGGTHETHGKRRDRPSEASHHGGELDERGLEADELAVSFYQEDRIDLTQMILEQIVLALPMKPLCRVDCRGLCPECGANRNTASCACTQEDTDPRWASLKTLLGR